MRILIFIGVFMMAGTGFCQVTQVTDIDTVSNTSEQLPYTDKTTKIIPCKSNVELNELLEINETGKVKIHAEFYCLCSDYLMDVKVKLSNPEKSYETITDKAGCDFNDLEPGLYKLEITYRYAKKFTPVLVDLIAGGSYRWKIFLCEK